MSDENDPSLRINALDYAYRTVSSSPSPYDEKKVIEVAEQYLAFLQGQEKKAA
jgi:hypothetical protein